MAKVAKIDTDTAGYTSIDAKGNSSLDASQGLITIGSSSAELMDSRLTQRRKHTHATRLGFYPDEYLPDEVRMDVSKSVALFAAATTTVAPSNETYDLEEMIIEVTHLKQGGLSIEEITRYVYEHLQDQQLPNFLCNLHLDQDGGLDRIKDLWNPQKLFWAFILFAFVLLNVAYLMQSNWTIFQGVYHHAMEEATALSQSAIHGELTGKTLISRPSALEEAAKDSRTQHSIFTQIENRDRRGLILKMAAVVGTCEVLRVMFSLLYIVYQIFTFFFHESEYKQYSELMNLFQESLPVLSTFSLMKYMSTVHPALIYSSFQRVFKESPFSHTKSGAVLVTMYFVLSTIALGVLSMFAFAMKLLSVGLKLIDSDYNFYGCLIAVAGFMNQCMGCVLFERVLQDRLFLFIFGGADTDFCEDELALKGVYRCRIAKQIWDDFYRKGERFKAIILLATFDHYDLQMLLINSPEEHERRLDRPGKSASRDLADPGYEPMEATMARNDGNNGEE